MDQSMASAINFRGISNQKGNVFALIFAAVGLVGVLGVVGMQTISGPIRTITNVTQKNITDTDLLTNARIVILNASTLPSNGDADADGYIEPIEYVPTTDPNCDDAPTGGGCLPSTIGAILTDPWGTDYGYCVWDHGSVDAGLDDSGTGTDNRLQGDETTSQPVLAIISAGPNRTFDTSCGAFDSTGVEGLSDPEGAGDDTVRFFTYSAALAGSGGLWSEVGNDAQIADPNVTDEIILGGGARIDIGGVNTGTAGTGSFPAVRVDALTSLSGTPEPVQMAGGFQVDDDTGVPNGDCAAGSDAGILRWNATGTALQVCSGAGGFVNVGGGDRIVDADGDTYIDVDTAGDGSTNTIMMVANNPLDGSDTEMITIDPVNDRIVFSSHHNESNRRTIIDHSSQNFLTLASNGNTGVPAAIFYYNNSPSTTGTIDRGLNIKSDHRTPDDLQVTASYLRLARETTGADKNAVSGYISLHTRELNGHPATNAATERMRINSSGNVEIYQDLTVDEDSGTAIATLHVDAANNRVGIGTLSPSSELHLRNSTNDPILRFTLGNLTNGTDAIVFEQLTSNRRTGEIRWHTGSNGDNVVLSPFMGSSASPSSLETSIAGQSGRSSFIVTGNDATGNYAAAEIDYTVNKTDGTNDYGFLIDKTDTASSGTSRLIEGRTDAVVQFWIDDQGAGYLRDSLVIGNATKNSNAILQADSSDKGFLPPRVANEAAMAGTVAGLMMYDNSTNQMKFHNGSSWLAMDGSGSVSQLRNVGNVDISSDPTDGYILQWDDTGKTWDAVAPSGLTVSSATSSDEAKILADDDGDTRIQVEESTDEDIIRFDIGGPERMRLSESSNEVYLNIYAGGSGVPSGLFVGQISGSPGAFFGRGPASNMALISAPRPSGNIRFTVGGSDLEAMYINTDGSIGIGTSGAANANAALEVTSANKGFLPPRVANEAAMAGTVAGLMMYDNSTNKMKYHTGTAWVDMGLADTDGDTRIQLEESADEDSVRIDIAGSERLRLYMNNNIGTNDTRLDLIANNTETSAMYFRAAGGLRWGSVRGDGNGLTIRAGQSANPKYIAFESATVEHSRFDSSGNLLLGTTTADGSAKLEIVSSSQGFLPPRLTNNAAATGTVAGLMIFNNATSDMEFYDGSGWRSMDAGASSDERLKKDIKPLQGSLEKLAMLTPSSYTWKDETRGEGQEIGLIAQDVKKVFPEVVSEDGNGFLQMDYGRLVSPIIDAIQEIWDLIQNIMADITGLKEENAQLKADLKSLQDSQAELIKRLETLEQNATAEPSMQ